MADFPSERESRYKNQSGSLAIKINEKKSFFFPSKIIDKRIYLKGEEEKG